MSKAPEQSPESTSAFQPVTGHDGPYPAPVCTGPQPVLGNWIDYNGHMNVGYYGIAFDKASDELFSRHLGVGEEHVAAYGQGPYVLQSHQHYLIEMRPDEMFQVRFRLIDHDAKRLHLFGDMLALERGVVAATQEIMVMNVDHQTGRSSPYPDWAIRRFARMKADHAGLKRIGQLGAALGIRRSG